MEVLTPSRPLPLELPSPSIASTRSRTPSAPSPRPTNPLLAALRRMASRVVSLRGFDVAIDVAITLSAVMQAAFRQPTAWWTAGYDACSYSPDPLTNAVLAGFDVGFTSLFCIELALKLLSHGVRGYLRDGWNWIDGIVTLLALLALLPAPLCDNLAGLSALRAVRLLRAMRGVPQFRAMGATVQAFLDATPKLGHVGLLACERRTTRARAHHPPAPTLRRLAQ